MAACNHLEHVKTQIPYATTVAICCFIGYFVAGFTGGNVIATLIVAIGCLAVGTDCAAETFRTQKTA